MVNPILDIILDYINLLWLTEEILPVREKNVVILFWKTPRFEDMESLVFSVWFSYFPFGIMHSNLHLSVKIAILLNIFSCTVSWLCVWKYLVLYFADFKRINLGRHEKEKAAFNIFFWLCRTKDNWLTWSGCCSMVIHMLQNCGQESGGLMVEPTLQALKLKFHFSKALKIAIIGENLDFHFLRFELCALPLLHHFDTVLKNYQLYLLFIIYL